LRDCFIKIYTVKATRCLEAYINVSYIHTFVLHRWILCTADMPVVLRFLETGAAKAVLDLHGPIKLQTHLIIIIIIIIIINAKP